MKIAYLSTFYPYRGGIAQFNASLFRAFEQEQHQVQAYTFTRQYPNLLFPGKTQYVAKGDIADPIPALRVLDSVNPLSYIAAANRIRQFCPDVLVMKYWMSFLAPSLGYVAGRVKQQGGKVITVVDNAIPHEPRFFDKAFARYFMQRNSGFVVMSEAVQRDVMSLYPQAQCLYAPHPLYNHFGDKLPKAEAQQQLGLDPTKRTLLFFGLIRDYKGLDLLIEAFGHLPAEYQLLIAGEPYGSFDKYQTQINALPNKERVYLYNRYIDDGEVPLFFSAADVCVLPYRSATQSGITSIAYHFDLPIIATDVGGLKETITHGHTGMVVPQPTVNLLQQGIVDFFATDTAVYAGHIASLKEQLSWDKLAQNIIRFSQSL